MTSPNRTSLLLALVDDLVGRVWQSGMMGWDPYDISKCRRLSPQLLKSKAGILLTQLSRLSPFNYRPLLGIAKSHNAKAMALLLRALLVLDRPEDGARIESIKEWLLDNRSRRYAQYVIGYDFDIILGHSHTPAGSPSLIVTLFALEALIAYHARRHDERCGDVVRSFLDLLKVTVPRHESRSALCFSYTFDKMTEIVNATALVGKFMALATRYVRGCARTEEIYKILNYLQSRQRADGSWPYGPALPYTDGFHTAFVLEAIGHMLPVADSADARRMFTRGLDHYRRFMFTPAGEPRSYHPVYGPRDIRRLIIKTDIRDCAMAIILFSFIKDRQGIDRTLAWTLDHMCSASGQAFYFRNGLFANKIEFIRFQAWMLLAIAKAHEAL